ncbi:MAG TPA: hypothetical protein VGM34_03150 [Chlamydiales bacterium]|jgi:hypothetical protein
MSTINQSGNSDLIYIFRYHSVDEIVAADFCPLADRITVLEDRLWEGVKIAKESSAELIENIPLRLEESQKTRWGWIAYKLNSDNPILRKIASALSWFLSKIFSSFERESRKQDTLLQLEKGLLTQYDDSKNFQMNRGIDEALESLNSSICDFLDSDHRQQFKTIITKRKEAMRCAQVLPKIRRLLTPSAS